MFSWEKEWDWKLDEWDKWLGLNLGMEAALDYTLGQPLSPDIFKLKKPDSLDVQGIAQSAMPKDGMPPQGPKGAQNEHEEFHAKDGGGAAPASGPAAQPNVAGTPAGAAGHKNQDPKGKNVKPGAPPKSAPPKKAPGKGPGQTGPNPKNNSKPTEPKLDATPITEPFTMHGESHQLIVQLGAGGHVDMASKRERLSVKVGQAVSKLIAKHASPEQVADLKEIGALAKKGDKMAVTAKTHDKEGTTKAAHQIAAYGAKWEVKDLDEVAIKAPHAIVVTHPVHLEKLPDALNKALGSAHSGQVIASKPGDPKEVTRQLLEEHADAHFDYASVRLTLPALNAAPLQAAHSVDQLGQLLAHQTGVTKVTLEQTEQKGELKFELIGSIGGATATLGTAVVDAVPHSLAVPQPVHLEKLSEPLAKALSSAHSGEVIFHGPGDPRQATRQLLQAHADAHFDFPTGKLTLPAAQPGPLQAAHSVEQLGQLLAHQTGVSKITIKKIEQNGEPELEFIGEIGVSATLGTAKLDAAGFQAVVSHGDMMGTPHTLTVTPDEVILASAAAPLETKVGKAKTNLQDAIGALPEQGSEAEADASLEKINANRLKIRNMLQKIPRGKTDKLPAGYDASKTATANQNLTPLAKEVIQLSADIMSAINKYGAKFKIHELEDPLPRYPSPDVGLHPVQPSPTNAKLVPPDNLPRESHHVPNNELYQTLRGELERAGKAISLGRSVLGFKQKSGFKKLGEAMLATAEDLKRKHGGDKKGKSGGKKLSAILVHRITHQNLNGLSGTAVHSAGMATLIEQAIAAEERELSIKYERIAKNEGISVNPGKTEWAPYVAKCKQRAIEAKTAAEKKRVRRDLEIVKKVENEAKVVSKEEKAALERIAAAQIRPVLRTAFESGLGHTFNALKTALELSRVDGPDNQKQSKLGTLQALAKETWSPLVEAQFTIPDDELDY